jgi:hypothetical protein
MNKLLIPAVVVVVSFLSVQHVLAADTDASPPKGVNVAIYDTGFALVNELRSAQLDKGENKIRFRQFPPRIDSSTVAFSFVAGGASVEVLEQQFQYDLAGVGEMLNRFIGKPVEIVSGTVSHKGVLLYSSESGAPLAIRGEDGAVSLFANSDSLTDIVFPGAAQVASLEPTLNCRMNAAQDSLQNLRVTYVTEGIRWNGSYDAILPEGGGSCFIVANANLYNESGGRFDNARVKLVSTEKGGVSPSSRIENTGAAPASRFSYGSEEPAPERTVASAGSLSTYELPRPLTMEPGAVLHVQLCMGSRVPVTKFYVYDGVRFDRFQRNRRNDWNYGTEFHQTVETHLQFGNSKDSGLGIDLPPGRFRLYQQKADASLDLIGEDHLNATPAGSTATVLLGPARGILGERERTGYSEVTPLHEYEESFEIRLENNSTEEIEIRVVEHLYRWNQFEIVKADTDYKAAGPQTIEFRPVLKPGGKRAVHYTVRYRW